MSVHMEVMYLYTVCFMCSFIGSFQRETERGVGNVIFAQRTEYLLCLISTRFLLPSIKAEGLMAAPTRRPAWLAGGE
jgi:hypothetical protein